MSPGPPAHGSPAPVRVFNRSDRVWVFGFVRMAPLVLLFGGITLLLVLHQYFKRLPDEVAVPLLFVCLVGPFVLDRLPSLNPVNYIGLGDDLFVQRLAGRPWRFSVDRVARIDLAPQPGEEYDDRRPGAGRQEVTIRLRRAWAARLLVTPEDARRVAAWGEREHIPIAQQTG